MAENWPRVSTILKDFNLIDVSWFEPKHSRRGRYVDECCNLLAKGKDIEPEWWALKSGDPQKHDEIEHEWCRPYVEAYVKFLAETRFEMMHCAVEVRNSVDRVIGHIDQHGWLYERPTLLDLKSGGESDWHRWQLGGYQPAVIETLKVVPDRFNLYLCSDGSYQLVQRKDRRDIVEFQALARAWWVLHPQGSQE